MSNYMKSNIQKAAYVLSFLAVFAVAFFGLTTVASAQSAEGWYGDDYVDWGASYYDDTNPSDGYYNQYGSNDDWTDYDNSFADYGNNDYSGYGYNDGYSNYGGYNDDYCTSCNGGYGDNYGYNDYYNYGDNNSCYYNDCYGSSDYYYPQYDSCGSGCSSGSNSSGRIDIWNNNVNTNTNVNNINLSSNVEEEDDYDHEHTHTHDNNDDENFDVTCYPDEKTVEEGDRVRWIAEIDGVNEDDVDFDWSGDANGNDQEVTERYDDAGTYRAKVRAEYRGQTETASCSVRVENKDRNNRVSLVSTPPTGTPASLNSVYLSQVPYTGAADNAKLIGFITMLTLSSLAGAYYIVTRKARADRKAFLDRFKQENLAAKA